MKKAIIARAVLTKSRSSRGSLKKPFGGVGELSSNVDATSSDPSIDAEKYLRKNAVECDVCRAVMFAPLLKCVRKCALPLCQEPEVLQVLRR